MGMHLGNLSEISIDGFQIVSGEMFSRFPKKNQASCTLWNTSIAFNKYAILSLNRCERIIIRVNAKEKCILLSPAPSSDKDSIPWIRNTKEIQGKKIDCKAFTSQLYKAWGFDPEYCFRSYGRVVTAENKVMLLFDFNKAENWKFRSNGKENLDG